MGLLFTLPFIVLFIAFTAIPIGMALFMSVTDVRGADLRNLFAVDFVAFSNYAKVLTDPTFWRAALNTSYFLGLGVPISMAIGFIVAIALDQGIRRLSNFFRGVFYVPVVVSLVSVALIWQYAFNQSGSVNSFLSWFGVQGPNWLGTPGLAMPVVLLLGIWRGFGTSMLLFLAGLQSVPAELHEAAALDGAGYWRRLRSITLPLLLPTILLVSLLSSIAYLQMFEEPYLVTKGGPLGSTQTLAMYVYHQFGYGNFATSSAASFILLALVVGVGALQFRALRSRT